MQNRQSRPIPSAAATVRSLQAFAGALLLGPAYQALAASPCSGLVVDLYGQVAPAEKASMRAVKRWPANLFQCVATQSAPWIESGPGVVAADTLVSDRVEFIVATPTTRALAMRLDQSRPCPGPTESRLQEVLLCQVMEPER